MSIPSTFRSLQTGFNLKGRHKPLKRGLIVAVLVIFISTLFTFLHKPKVQAQIFLTSGTTWTVPIGWNNNNNSIGVIGAGGGGGGGTNASGTGYGGGGGGGYSQIVNATLTAGASVTIAVGAAGTGGASGGNNGGTGGDTYLCSSTSACTSITDTNVIVGAKGGAGGTSTGGGAGGNASGGIGTTTFTGGSGGGIASGAGNAGGGAGGAGGAAGPNNNGNNGATGSGGSGNVGGPGATGGSGDGGNGGAGGSAGAANTVGGTGGNGTEFDATHGSGGGGGGGGGGDRDVTGGPGGTSGSYGAGGGGGGGGGRSSAGGAGAAGKAGLIRITYGLSSLSDYRWRLDDGNETSGSSLASQNTAATINYGTDVRLRINIINTGDSNLSFRLEYAPYSNGCYSWTVVPNTATTEHFNMFNTSNYADQAASTNVSSGPGVITDPPGYTFTAGKLVESPSNTTALNLTDFQFTEIEYALQANGNATNSSYCFRVTKAGVLLDEYAKYPILNINYPPATPTIHSVANGATNVLLLPIFQLRSTDQNNDYLQYVVETCPVNSFPCASGGHTYDQTTSQACWSLQDANSGTAFASYDTIARSTMAYCETPLADLLSPNTTYYWRAKAIDPAGTNTYSSYSSVASFTTGTLQVNIIGGSNINGGTIIGN